MRLRGHYLFRGVCVCVQSWCCVCISIALSLAPLCVGDLLVMCVFLFVGCVEHETKEKCGFGGVCKFLP